MSALTQCPGCARRAFLISALVHLALAAAVLLPGPGGQPGTGGGEAVDLTLAMFASESPAAAARVADASDAEPELTQAEPIPPTPEDNAEPEPAESTPQSSPPPETSPPPKAAAVPQPKPELTASVAPEPEPEPEAKPAAAPKPAPVEPPRTKPASSQTKAVTKPKPPAQAPAQSLHEKETKRRPPARPQHTHSPPKRHHRRADHAAARRREAAADASARARGGGSGGRHGAAGTGTAARAAESRYLEELQRAIARHRYYPSAARRRSREGKVTVSFVILADGRITSVRVTNSSGVSSLDDAAVRTLRDLGRFKPIPAQIGRTRWALRVPINFALR